MSIDCRNCGNFTVGSGRPVITSAVRHDDGSPGVKVKWTTMIPPECILSVTVWSQYGDHHTSTNVTQTDEATLSDLQCDTQYDLALRVYHLPTGLSVFSNTVSVYVGGMSFKLLYGLQYSFWVRARPHTEHGAGILMHVQVNVHFSTVYLHKSLYVLCNG